MVKGLGVFSICVCCRLLLHRVEAGRCRVWRQPGQYLRKPKLRLGVLCRAFIFLWQGRDERDSRAAPHAIGREAPIFVLALLLRLDRSLNDLKLSEGRFEIVAGHLFCQYLKEFGMRGFLKMREQLLKDVPGVEVIVLKQQL